MMETDLAARLLDLLPAGEYTQVSCLADPEGLMATRFSCVLATAMWERLGRKPCFLKGVFVAGDQAGQATQLLTGSHRLERLNDRINKMMNSHTRPPIVTVYDVRFLGERELLLLNMERVRPLQDFVQKGEPSLELAVKILRQFNPPGIWPSWHHFDLCLRNIGLNAKREVVFIDLDSVYLVENPMVMITSPVGKGWRWPQKLSLEIETELDDLGGQMNHQTALRKQRFDLALCAAELSLAEPILNAAPFADEWIEGWLDRAAQRLPSLASFWRSVLVPALNDADVLNVEEIANSLERAGTDPTVLSQGVMMEELHDAVTEPMAQQGATHNRNELARLLRNEKLNVRQIEDYAALVERALEEQPLDFALWRELRGVYVGYLRDPARALDLVTRARRVFPEDNEMRRWENIIRVWGQVGGR